MHLPLALMGNAARALVWPLLWYRRARAAPHGAWLTVKVDRPIVEVAPPFPFWDRRHRPIALQDLRECIDLAVNDKRVTGIVVELEHLHGGSATATALRDVLLRVRRGGKRLAVYLPKGGGTRECFVASAADTIVVGPETHLAPVGYAIEAHYLKGLLDRAGVKAEVLARGRYKTAGEMFVSESMSEPQREQIDALLDAAWESLVEALATGRGVDREWAERWVNKAPWSAERAVEQRLADAIAYPDELAQRLDPSRKEGAKMIGAGEYLARRRMPWTPLRNPYRLAVIEVHGPIASSEPVSVLPLAAENRVCDALRHALEDDSVKGAIVHIDSRGGSALASDRMLHEVRRLAEKKPVVACMNDAAASGGYMVAVGAHAIVAQPTTLTGSIGVVMARLALEPLLQRAGIGTYTLKRGDRADLGAASRLLRDDERAVLEQEIDDVYQSFLRVVAQGRKQPVEAIEPLAAGRVWCGRDAARRGLIDKIGGFDVALEELRRRIGPEARRMKPFVVVPKKLRPPESLLPRILHSWAQARGLEALWMAAAPAMTASPERVWAWCPLQQIDAR